MLLNKEEVIKRFMLTHGHLYDYSKVNYTGSMNKVVVICKRHGEFTQVASRHISGSGCVLCAIEKRILSTKDFIEKSVLIHGDKYDYSESIYRKTNIPIIIICKKHGRFLQKPNKHISSKRGCSICGGSKKLTTEEFIKKSNKIHHDKYSYVKSNYINKDTKLVITCPDHGDFLQEANSHMRSAGCPKCRESKGENEIRVWLTNKKIQYTCQKKFSECKNKRTLIFDFHVPKLNTCIEFDGMQHFRVCGYGGTADPVDLLKKIQANDMIKNNFCANNNINLIRISYHNIKNIDTILSNKLGC